MDASDSREFRRSRQARATACGSCYERKVRCDVKATGQPCTSCVSSNIICQLRTRKSYPKRKTGTSRASSHATSSVSPKDTINSSFNKTILGAGGSTSEPLSTARGANDQSVLVRHDQSVNEENLSIRNSREIDALTKAIVADGPVEGETPVFVGDQQGIGYIIDAMKTGGPPRPQHYFVPRRAASLLQSEDLFFLKAKGCFSLPEQDISNGLLKCYFRYTHPMFPIIDMGEFLKTYTSNGFRGCNLLLLWSMFSVAGSYVDDELLAMAGYKSRKEMKRSFYHRAKCLYDNGDEEDMIVLTQAALLLGFWFSGPENHTASWHWTGRAISIAQTLGLHRDFKAKQTSAAFSDRRHRLWRRIWWACFFRDRWQSLGMGRPMRINEDDCDIPVPSVEDVTQDLEEPSTANLASRTYVPEGLETMSCIWVELIKLSIVLGRVLILNYQPRRVKPNSAEVHAFEKSICEIIHEKTPTSSSGLLCGLCVDTLDLFKQAAIIALYRPFLTSDDQDHTLETTTPALAHKKTVSAAAATNVILERMMAGDAIKALGPMIPTLLVPTMHTHLLQSKSENSAAKLLGLHRLELCLLVLQELEHNYPAAGIFRSLFIKAKASMDTTTAGQPLTSENNGKGVEPEESALDGSILGGSTSNAGVEDNFDNMLSESFIEYPQVMDHDMTFYPVGDAAVNYIMSGDEFSFSENMTLSV